MNSIEHHITKDGSSTLFSKVFDQYYHNPNGAVSESRHVFFESTGLTEAIKSTTQPISIFEMGFGTGLNFLLLLDYYSKLELSLPIQFYSVEAFPADPETIEHINYQEVLGDDSYKEFLRNVFTSLKSGWNSYSLKNYPNITLNLFYGTFQDLEAPETSIDFFFHDPFSPEVNGELWTVETFEKLKNMASSDAVLSTYCAASKARAALAKAGWYIAKTRGALGKREMTIASLNDQKLSSYKRLKEARLIERFDRSDFG
ncbi:MAG: tRNA (5-methylaminomethyl-2-thiouridine)(34)-methyltransferase MnmD [Balneolaceae bacterium]|nr:tRNA (5-methylaminomethyl-2-thiouridine)(34)-methyltransferase MnmD [Balneolaceae bacterium]